MKSIEEKAAELLRNLDITKLKEESKNTNILLQQLLQKLMLTYVVDIKEQILHCLLYTSPSPRDRTRSRMPSSA